MHYTIGDHPAPVAIEPASVDDLDAFTAVEGELVLESGTALHVDASLGAEPDTIDVDLGVLGVVGRHELRLVLAGAGVALSLAPLPVIVEHEDGQGWYTLPAARRDWPSAPSEDGRLFDLLDAAREQCLEYAPALDPDERPPRRYKQAQLLQARNIWNAAKTDPGATSLGVEGFAAPIFPLDWTVRQMLRPARAVPVIG